MLEAFIVVTSFALSQTPAVAKNQQVAITTLDRLRGGIGAIDFSSCGESFCATSSEKELAHWKIDKSSGKWLQITKLTVPMYVEGIRCGDKGVLLAYHDENVITLAKTDSGQLVRFCDIRDQGKEERPGVFKGRIDLSPSAKTIAFRSKDGIEGIWRAPFESRIGLKDVGLWGFERKAHGSFCTAFSPDESRIAVLDYKLRLNVYEVNTGKLLKSAQLPEGVAEWGNLRFSQDGDRIAVSMAIRWGYDVWFGLFDCATGNLSRRGTFEPIKEEKVRGTVFSKDLDAAYCCDSEGRAVAYDLVAKKRRVICSAPADYFYNIAISPDDRLIATGGAKGTVYLVPVAK
jgi:WD40 repeat protein